MNEKNIKNIINAITEQYGYLLEDIRSVKSNDLSFGLLIKDISGAEYRLIFMTVAKYK